MTGGGKLTVEINVTVHRFICAIAEILSETFLLPLDSIRACRELGYNYQEYRHMWE